jgi:hypothetical protein
MSTGRTVKVRLTPAQYNALAGAVARAELDMTVDAGDGHTEYDAELRREVAVLNRAWNKIRAAWYDAGRGKARA